MPENNKENVEQDAVEIKYDTLIQPYSPYLDMCPLFWGLNLFEI